MICHRVPAIEEALGYIERLPENEVERALTSVARFKSKLVPPDTFSEAAFSEVDGEVWRLRAAVLGEERAAQRSPEDGKRSPVRALLNFRTSPPWEPPTFPWPYNN